MPPCSAEPIHREFVQGERCGQIPYERPGPKPEPNRCRVGVTFARKKLEMKRNRLFNVLVAIILVIVIALTVREALATSVTTFQTHTSITCSGLPSRFSIHTVEGKGTAMRLPFTEDGPTGVDGGLKELFSSYRTCSRKGE